MADNLRKQISTEKPKERKLETWLLRVLQGVLVGGGAILPGVSGGVLCVVFGIYRPIMELLSHPLKALRRNLFFFVPVILGVALGFWGFARLMKLLFSGDSPYPISLFVGLILGTLPSLYANAGREGRKGRDLAAAAAGFVLLLAILLPLEWATELKIHLNTLWSFLSGIIWGFSLVVPGLSSSSILLYFGVYGEIMGGVGNMDLSVILPLGLGIALVAFVFARLINRLFERHFSIASHGIIGLVLASTLLIAPRVYDGLTQGLLCALLAVVGFAAAFLMGKWNEGIRPEELPTTDPGA